MSANKARIGRFLAHLMKQLKTVKSILPGETDTFHGAVFDNGETLSHECRPALAFPDWIGTSSQLGSVQIKRA